MANKKIYFSLRVFIRGLFVTFISSMRAKKYFSVFVAAFFSAAFVGAQSGGGYEGNALFSFLGKSASGEDIKNLAANYNCERINESHYLCKDGIELILQKGVLSEIHLYKTSAVYGGFKGRLPKDLRFGMGSGDVKRLLGKPLVSYSSGYCEFELPECIVSCWFDGSSLSQVHLTLKPVN